VNEATNELMALGNGSSNRGSKVEAGAAGTIFPLIIRPHRARLELAARTPALRARGLDNLYQTQQAVASALDSESSTDRLRNSVAVGACLAAVSAALFQWAMGQGKDDPVALAREAFIVIGAKLEGEQNEPRKIRRRRR
jgi:MftR C-terminal domain